jgi:hypothetical protein
LLALLAVGVVTIVASAAPAGAGEAKGCAWSVESVDRDGKVIDTARGPGAGATQDDPLLVDLQGVIRYKGTTDEVIAHGSWTVTTSGGLAISFGGDVTNDSGDTEKSGTEKLGDRLTVDLGGFGTLALFSGLIHVDFEATGEGGATCTASGWLETTGNEFGSLPFFGGVIGIAVGLGLVVSAWPVSPAGGSMGSGSMGSGSTGAGSMGGGPGSGSAPGTGATPSEGTGPRPGPIGGGSAPADGEGPRPGTIGGSP